MGFRFRRSIRVAPGVKLNLGRKSASVSVGTRGLWYTTGTSGQRVTAGIPGTGLSYTTLLRRSLSIWAPAAIALLVAVAVIAATL